ncbi:TPA: hypothetical protein ACPVX0_004743, partial [Vibrio parahaemolyticus]
YLIGVSMKSREVYQDCIHAKEYLEKAIEEGDYTQAKILWFSCVTLLRAIGHVLDKVDKHKYDVEFERELSQRFSKWKSVPIFRDFIDEERNQILKEYKSSVEVNSTKKVFALVTSDGRRLVTSTGQSLTGVSTLRELVKAKGAYTGASPITVLENAIQWWDTELLNLESFT